MFHVIGFVTAYTYGNHENIDLLEPLSKKEFVFIEITDARLRAHLQRDGLTKVNLAPSEIRMCRFSNVRVFRV